MLFALAGMGSRVGRHDVDDGARPRAGASRRSSRARDLAAHDLVGRPRPREAAEHAQAVRAERGRRSHRARRVPVADAGRRVPHDRCRRPFGRRLARRQPVSRDERAVRRRHRAKRWPGATPWPPTRSRLRASGASPCPRSTPRTTRCCTTRRRGCSAERWRRPACRARPSATATPRSHPSSRRRAPPTIAATRRSRSPTRRDWFPTARCRRRS